MRSSTVTATLTTVVLSNKERTVQSTRYMMVLCWALCGVATADADVSKIFWANDTSIARTRLGGAQTVLPDLGNPRGIALDLSAGKVYWADRGSGPTNPRRIARANMDGTCVETLVADVLDLGSLALDVVGNKVYWTDNVDGSVAIRRADLDGNNVENQVLQAPSIHAVALDVDAGMMYWGEGINNGYRIRKANLEIPEGQTATNRTDIQTVITLPTAIKSLAIEAVGGKVYWTEGWSPSKVRRANLDGSVPQDLVTGGKFWGIAVDPASGIYWAANETDAEIRRANLDGTQSETLLTAETIWVRGLAIVREPASSIRGDMNADGLVNGIDVELFVRKLLEMCP